MASEDATNGDETETESGTEGARAELRDAKQRLEEGADKAVDEFDQGVVDLLAWLLDTETRARIYVYLRQHENSTSEEVADGTGLYPSTVREALADLHDEGTVTRHKRESDGAGNNPYEYQAIAPSELVRETVGQVQNQLNAVFELEGRLGRDEDESDGPVTITVAGDDAGTDDDDDDDGATDDLTSESEGGNDEDDVAGNENAGD